MVKQLKSAQHAHRKKENERSCWQSIHQPAGLSCRKYGNIHADRRNTSPFDVCSSVQLFAKTKMQTLVYECGRIWWWLVAGRGSGRKQIPKHLLQEFLEYAVCNKSRWWGSTCPHSSQATDKQMASQKEFISWVLEVGSLHRLPSDSLAARPASGTDCGSGVLNESSGLWLPLTLKEKKNSVWLWCASDLENSLAFLHHTSVDESNWDLQFHEQLGHNVASSKAIRCAEIVIEWAKLLFICVWKRRNILCCKVFIVFEFLGDECLFWFNRWHKLLLLFYSNNTGLFCLKNWTFLSIMLQLFLWLQGWAAILVFFLITLKGKGFKTAFRGRWLPSFSKQQCNMQDNVYWAFLNCIWPSGLLSVMTDSL